MRKGLILVLAPAVLAAALAPIADSAALAQAPLPRPEPGGTTEPEAKPAGEAGPLPRPEAAEGTGRPAPGWTLRAVPDGSTVALGGGAGRVASLAAFCLGGAPWLALELAPRPEAESVRAAFGFSGERIEAEALREEGAGDSYVIELAEGPLAALLAGADARATLALDGTQQGTVSLSGSSAAIRGALEGCHEF